MDNGSMPAMPVTVKTSANAIAQSRGAGIPIDDETVYKGLTIREHFAGLAMQGYMSNSLNIDIDDDSITLIVSVVDALLKELGK